MDSEPGDPSLGDAGGSGTRALVSAAARGDEESVRALWHQHRRWVAAILLAHKPKWADLDDLLQDVAMAYVKNIRTLRDESAFKPWLRTIAVNAARAEARRPTRVRSVAPEQLAAAGSAEPGADGKAARDDEAARALRAANELPDGYREPLLLRCVQGLSYRQISQIMDLPETTVETRIARGRRMLRELVARQSEPVLARIGQGDGIEAEA